MSLGDFNNGLRRTARAGTMSKRVFRTRYRSDRWKMKIKNKKPIKLAHAPREDRRLEHTRFFLYYYYSYKIFPCIVPHNNNNTIIIVSVATVYN